MFKLRKKKDVTLRVSRRELIEFVFFFLAIMIFLNIIKGRKNFDPEDGRERIRNMGLTNLDTALLDMIPSDCKLCIERNFGYIYLTLRKGVRTQSVRIHSNKRPTDENLKATIAFMVEEMKKEE